MDKEKTRMINGKFLKYISNMLDRDNEVWGMEDELYHILDTKTLCIENIEMLFRYLHLMKNSNDLYFYELKNLIENKDECPYLAIDIVEDMICEEEYIYDEILKYFNTADILMNYYNGEVA